MTAALELAQRLDADAILAMHAALVGDLHPEIAGRWREEQVWIGGTSFGPHQADFIPPHHEHVPALIDDLVAFVKRDDLPLLAQAAVAHAQFETIHPFPDGNGRTGRALIHSMLRGHGLTQNVTVPVSAGLLTDTAALLRVADGLPRRRSVGDRRAARRRLLRGDGERSSVGAGPAHDPTLAGTRPLRRGATRRPGGWPTCCCASR